MTLVFAADTTIPIMATAKTIGATGPNSGTTLAGFAVGFD